MHDRLFSDPKQLAEDSLIARGRVLQLNMAEFTACLDGQAAREVQQDASTAAALVVNGTPTFFIGTLESDGQVKVVQRLSGAVPFVQLRELLDKLLAERRS